MFTRRSLLCYLSLVISIAVFSANLQISSADTFRPVVRGRRGVVAGERDRWVAGHKLKQREHHESGEHDHRHEMPDAAKDEG